MFDRLKSWWGKLSPKNMATQQRKLSDIQEWSDFFGGPSGSVAGPVVSADNSLQCSAVYACVRLISSCISSSPLGIFEETIANDRIVSRPILDHKFIRMLSKRPIPAISASVFWKFVIQHKLLSGNGYAAIIRDRFAVPYRLIPLHPARVVPYQAWQLGMSGFDKVLNVEPEHLFYFVTWDNGTFSVLPQEDMLHFPNMGWDRRRGLSTIRAATQAVGLAFAAEENGALFFSNASEFQYALTYPKPLSPEAQDKLRDYYQRKQAGLINAHMPLVVVDGGDVKPVSMSARDAQLLESRQYSVIDICRFFGVPPVMIGETEKTSSWGTGVEQVGRWFVMFTLNDHFTDIEQELNTKLFGDYSSIKAQFDESELMRGDTKAISEFYKIALGNMQEPGFMTQNEVRSDLKLPPDADPESDKLQRAIRITETIAATKPPASTT